jgi:hypothetical protein
MKKNTKERDRGNPFVQRVRMWRILHENREPLNKHRLAQIFFNVEKTNETKKRFVQRLVESLNKIGIALYCDKDGNKLSQRQLDRILKKTPSAERFWKYNAGEWASELGEIDVY